MFFDTFLLTFVLLILCCGYLGFNEHRKSQESPAESIENESTHGTNTGSATRFKYTFLSVYLLVMASDWLQGPYIYTLYKDEKGLAESVVAALFTTGFVSAAISATFVGSFADRFGRKRFCLIFCGLYSLSCLTVLSNDLLTLFIGRVAGGVSTTLMYSIFESWMVTEYHARQLERSTLTMGSLFGTMTTLNGAVAILSGVTGEAVVAFTGTKTSPFITSIACLVLAAYAIQTTWTENYGDTGGNASDSSTTKERSGLQIILEDKRILVLGLISTCFEGSMYLFVFFWSAALKSSHAIAGRSTDLPFGLIFATFMASMMLGSLLFSLASASSPSGSPFSSSLSHANILVAILVLGSVTLLLPVFIRNESFTFWCFCIYEACVGVYFPSMGNLKGTIVGDGVRAKVYGVLRVPLNVFVVIALSLTQEGDTHRQRIYMFCGGLLLLASMAANRYLIEDTSSSTQTEQQTALMGDREE